MSLSQRLHSQLEKKMEGQFNDVEQLQNVIRQLKLLSKSQTTLLKAYLNDKLNTAATLVSKASNYLDARNNDGKARELSDGLKSLKLEDIDIDVTSTKIALQEELSKLRFAIDNNGYGPGGSSTATVNSGVTSTSSITAGGGSNAQDLQRIHDLEGENAKLSQQIAELRTELTKSNNNNTKATQQASTANQEEVNKLRQENEKLNNKIKDLSSTIDKNNQEINDAQQRINDLTRLANDTTKEKTLQSEIETLRKQLQDEKQSKITLQKEIEQRYTLQIKELNGLNEQKLKEKEDEWTAEREEMEVALAQELEEVEKTKDEEIANITLERDTLQKKIKQLQQFNTTLTSSLKRVVQKMASVQQEYKQHTQSIKRDLSSGIGSIKTEYGGTLINKIRYLGEEVNAVNKKYQREMVERKRLHNIIQELKGNIRVYLRCRPPTTKELDTFGNDAMCVSFPNPGEIRVFNSEKNREKSWEFDEVFDINTTQSQVYADVSALVVSVLDGFNVCIFAYGQTGSGKTHTMMGTASNPGVNTRALEELFQRTQERAGEWVDSISVSILEVYNEDIRDLLNEGKGDDKLEVKMGEYGNYVPGLTHISVTSMEQVLSLIARADRVRSSSTTNMNEHSSRSHMMLTVTVVSEFLPTKLVTRGKLNLVDLAGSERINKSGAQGQALKEAQNINRSLFALGDVIAARAQKNAHIPFRNSTLTFLLQDSLSQDSKTLMIVCISPVLYNCEETTCSLNFAAKVKTVELGRASKQVQSAGVGGGSTKSTGSIGGATANRRSSIGK